MARPVKHNLEYFPLDVTFWDNHKMILIEEECGVKGGYLAIRLMAMVYEQGYYLEWKDKSEISCAKRVGNGYSGASVLEILKSCLRHGLFDKDQFLKNKILTSRGIQERWNKVMKDLRRKVEIKKDFCLINEEETGVSAEETPDNDLNNAPSAAESTLKESKGNESKEKKGIVPAAPSPPQKSGRKIKAEEVTEPYWDALVKVWFDFNEEKSGEPPSFKDKDPKNLKSIVQLLKKRALAKSVIWNEVTAPERLKVFLVAAFSDKWLSEHFLLENLYKQFDAIIQKQKAASDKTKTAAGQQGNPIPKSLWEEVSYLLDRFMDGELDQKYIKPSHYDILVSRGNIEPGLIKVDGSRSVEDQKCDLVIQYFNYCKNQKIHGKATA